MAVVLKWLCLPRAPVAAWPAEPAPSRWRGPVALRLHRRAGAAVAGVADVGEPVAAATTTDALRGTQKLLIVVIRDAPPP